MSVDHDRLLIAVDVPSNRQRLATIGRRAKFDVATACDDEQVARKLMAFAPTVVMLHFEKRDSNIVDMLQLLRDSKSDTKIVLVGNLDKRKLASAVDLAEIMGLSMCGVLRDPVPPNQLHSKLNTLKLKSLEVSPHELKTAIDTGMIRPCYQPIAVRSVEGQWSITETEAMPYWRVDQRQMTLRRDLIDIAENAGLRVAMTNSLFVQLAEQLQCWKDCGLNLSASVRLCASVINDLEFPSRLEEFMQSKQIENSILTLELPEAGIAQSYGSAMNFLTRLQRKGFGLAIHDFGSGYTSLEQLCRMPVCEVKIDPGLVSEIDTSSDIRRVVEAIILLAHKLGFSVSATGVQTANVFNLLEELGCHRQQGVFVGRPVSADHLAAHIREWNG